jgi:hypothetical protein
MQYVTKLFDAVNLAKLGILSYIVEAVFMFLLLLTGGHWKAAV